MIKDSTKKEVIKSEKTMSNVTKYKHDERKIQKKNYLLDKVKFIFALIIVTIGIVSYYVIPSSYEMYDIRMAFPIIGIVLALLIVFYWCSFGKKLIVYIRESTQEMHKVVWPDKITATRVTITVIIFVAILSLFMFASDSLISYVFFDILFKRG